MDYWAATMQDDCYLIAAHGWVADGPHREGRQEISGAGAVSANFRSPSMLVLCCIRRNASREGTVSSDDGSRSRFC
jgi:hypothetical protein